MSELHTRKEKRTPVTLKIKFKSATLDQFIERYSVDVSHGGIFIRTKDPLAVGTQLRFEFQLQDSSPLISGDGTVVWTREFDPSRVGVAPGMGVRFDRLAPESQPVLEQILNRKAGSAAHSHPDRFDAAAGSTPGITGEKTRITPPTLANSLAASSRLPSSPGAGAPQPSMRGTLTGLAPARSGFVEEQSKDATPLPKPMRFDAGGEDEFSEDVFEQPTKVASLETLLKHEEEHARQAQAERAAAEAAAETDEEEQTAVSRRPPAVAQRPRSRTPVSVDAATPPMVTQPPVAVDSVDEPTPHGRPSLASASGAMAGEPRFLDSLHKGPEVRVASDLQQTVSARAKPAPVGTGERRSLLPVLTGALLLVLAAAAVYFFVLRNPEDETPARPPSRATPVRPAAVTPPSPTPAPPPTQTPTPTPTQTPTPPVAVPPPAARGRIKLIVNPALADVTLDGVAASTGSIEVDAGKHELLISAPCFRDEKLAVDVKADETRDVSLKLKPLERVVRVTSDPPSAMLLVDGKVIGRTPSEVRLVGRLDPRARHTFVVRKAGFEDTQTVVAPDAACATDGEVAVVGLRLSLTPMRGRQPAQPRPRPQPASTPPPAPAPEPRPASPEPTEAKPEPGEPRPSEPVEVKPAPAEVKPEATPPMPVEPAPAPTEVKPEPTPAKPVETKPSAPPEAAPAKPETPAAKPANKDCDPSPDAPEWARCK